MHKMLHMNGFCRSVCAGLFLVALMSSAVLADDAESKIVLGGDSEKRLAEVASYLKGQMESKQIPGLSVAVVDGGQLVWSDGFGLADVEGSVPATAQTTYNIGSISMSVTAVGMLRLVADGKIELGADVRNWVPEYPKKKATFTVRQLLEHRAGVRQFRGEDEFINRKNYARLVDALDLFKSDRLLFAPGERFHLSAYGYVLLGIACERLSGKSFSDFVRDDVAGALNMPNTGVEDRARIVPGRARGYVLDESGELNNAPFIDSSARAPADGMVSTAVDLARFSIALQKGEAVPGNLRDLAWTPQSEPSGKTTPYGLGFFVREHMGRRIVGHSSGGTPNGSSMLLMYPDDGVSIVLLTNLGFTNVSPMGLHIGSLIIGPDQPD